MVMEPPPLPVAPPEPVAGPRPAPAPVAPSPVAAAPVAAQSKAAPAAAAAAPAPAPIKAPERKPVVAAEPEPRSKTGLIVAIAVIVLIVLAGAGYFLTRPSKPAPPTADSYAAINAIPWGTVKSLNSADGKRSIAVNQVTPVRLAVPVGEYNVIIAGPDGTERSQPIKTSRDAPASCTVVFEAIDVEQIVNSH